MLIETLAAAMMLSGAAPQGGGQERVAPRGDYRESCSGEYVNRGRLYADCRDRRNNVRGSSIELNRCGDYEIRNDNGLLVCGPVRGEYEDQDGGGPGGPGGGWDRPPRGDYQDSCVGIEVTRGRLYADCRTRSPGFRRSSIELRRCRDNEIRNDDGLLVCGSWRGQYEGQGGGGPGGGWGRQSITVYQDSNFRGASQRFDGEIANLGNSGLNDQISSMELRGSWEVCTDAYFRGRCQTFTSDIRNLSGVAMNDRISSLRPVRR